MAHIQKSNDSKQEEHHDTNSTITDNGHEHKNAIPVANSNHLTIGKDKVELNDVNFNAHTQNKAAKLPVNPISIHTNEIHVVH